METLYIQHYLAWLYSKRWVFNHRVCTAMYDKDTLKGRIHFILAYKQGLKQRNIKRFKKRAPYTR